MKKNAMILCLALMSVVTMAAKRQKSYDVAAYLYPAYVSDDPRLRPFWPLGMGEWETVMTMQQRHPGHYWRRYPLWGYINEADPAVMEMEIEQATRHGVNVFIFDWYWFDGRPFMETTLTNGFLQAGNRSKMQFYLMWANHDVLNYWDTRISHLGEDNVIWRGGIDRAEFEKICRRNIELFFKQPNYYKIKGKPVFMIYDVKNFIDGLGGMEEAADAVKWFRKEVQRAGFPGLELQLTMWAPNLNYSGFDTSKTDKPEDAFTRRIGFDSSSHYQFCHFLNVNDEYSTLVSQAAEEWERLDRDFTIPYYPHVSIGWDNSPRTGSSAVARNNTPEQFEQALRKAKAYVDARPDLHPLITINSWNEWTETSYLQPDNVYGYGYLEALKRVFVDESATRVETLVAPSASRPPLVYGVENSGAHFPKPSLPAVSDLPVIRDLPDPLLGVDGFGDWERKRNEIAAQIQHYGIGVKPAVDKECVKARMDEDTLEVTVTVEGQTLVLRSTIHYPRVGRPPYALLIGTSMISLPRQLFEGRPIATMTFHEKQVNDYSQWGPHHERGEHAFDRLYPELKDNGAYSEWSWGLSRLLDGLQLLGSDVTKIDMEHIGVTGCSYAGKMALYCGAFDERVALTIAQEPGGGGAAAWRASHRNDSVENLEKTDYHWFLERQRTDFSGDNVYRLPYDQHELCAMVCPRALLLIGNPDWRWLADDAMLVSAKAAVKVWERFGIGDRMGWSIMGGHGHCQLPEAQWPEVQSFIDHFLLGRDVSTADVRIAP